MDYELMWYIAREQKQNDLQTFRNKFSYHMEGLSQPAKLLHWAELSYSYTRTEQEPWKFRNKKMWEFLLIEVESGKLVKKVELSNFMSDVTNPDVKRVMIM